MHEYENNVAMLLISVKYAFSSRQQAAVEGMLLDQILQIFSEIRNSAIKLTGFGYGDPFTQKYPA